jgi:hypothetical protein
MSTKTPAIAMKSNAVSVNLKLGYRLAGVSVVVMAASLFGYVTLPSI